jgi:hypothetical protein
MIAFEGISVRDVRVRPRYRRIAVAVVTFFVAIGAAGLVSASDHFWSPSARSSVFACGNGPGQC